MLCADPRVRCTTIGELAEEIPELLTVQNAAGYAMLQADRAAALARPYTRLLHALVTILGGSPPRDPRGVEALQAYWQGENNRAATLAQERILWGALMMRVARLLTVAVAVVVMVVIGWGLRRSSFRRRVAVPGAVGILLPIAVLIVVVLTHPFSQERITDIADMASLVAGSTGVVLALQVLRPRRGNRRADAAQPTLPGGSHNE
jgi:hypothetical protein